MDNPSQAHIVQAGGTPALPGKVPSGGVVPGIAGVPPASGPKAHRCVEAGGTPALPGKSHMPGSSVEMTAP